MPDDTATTTASTTSSAATTAATTYNASTASTQTDQGTQTNTQTASQTDKTASQTADQTKAASTASDKPKSFLDRATASPEDKAKADAEAALAQKAETDKALKDFKLKAPEKGLAIDDKRLAAIAKIAVENKISPEGAQKLLDAAAAASIEDQTAHEAKLGQFFDKEETTLKSDPKFGGQNYEKSVAHIVRGDSLVLEKAGFTKQEADQYRQWSRDNRGGDMNFFKKILHFVAQSNSEDTARIDNTNAAAQKSSEVTGFNYDSINKVFKRKTA